MKQHPDVPCVNIGDDGKENTDRVLAVLAPYAGHQGRPTRADGGPQVQME